MDNRDVFIALLRNVNRPGIEEFINWLDTTDFFNAPASPKLFRNYPGGLCEQALVRCDLANYLNKFNNLGFNNDSVILISLLANINKADYFELVKSNKKCYTPNGKHSDNDGKRYDWIEVTNYMAKPPEERFVFGTSGQNAERLISNYIPLTDEESSAIINMSIVYENPTFYFGEIYKKNPLAALLNAADTLATFVVKEVEPF